MREVNLRSIDLNLLVVLQALLEARHVTRASEQLSMSQPAVSRALQRLRITFDDPLLVRTSQGFDLSARGRDILPRLQRLTSGVEQLIAEPQFDPSSAMDVVRVYGLDLEVACFVAPLLKVLRVEAPQMRLEVRTEPRNHFELLDSGEVHFSLTGMQPVVGEGQYRRLLIAQSGIVCMMSADNPLADGELTLERYLSASHGLVSMTGKGPGHIDERLAELGHQRHLALRLSNFMTAADFCDTSDLLFILPEIVAQRVAKGRNIVLKPVPVELTTSAINFFLYWHERYHHDPMCCWVRQRVLQVLS
ncbi:LysR family transcriptional regulator [Amphritea sp. 1_MG-2023]|uniref:LysR family transcriptional regulator n=1 Tax=Amphritea sp. 1_MG-2023 TaxID=3062670 RepID=UPI0026E3966D|nr:LysR family transcriptional regulator [Amphritea sp. 1_MG-2023]MDO6563805.1 LysR family transcriptional regulator [Amphritea sp. 1_MG-2023]